jgi:dihydrofolate reductase
MRKITIVVAVGYGDNGIGSRGKLPWHLPEDLKHFRKVTMGQTCIVGHNTYIKMPYLDGRKTRVVPLTAAESTANLEAWLENFPGDLMIIGGAHIYKIAFPLATHMIMTRVGIALPAGTCDAFFPRFEWEDWTITQTEYPDDDHRLAFFYMERNQ